MCDCVSIKYYNKRYYYKYYTTVQHITHYSISSIAYSIQPTLISSRRETPRTNHDPTNNSRRPTLATLNSGNWQHSSDIYQSTLGILGCSECRNAQCSHRHRTSDECARLKTMITLCGDNHNARPVYRLYVISFLWW